MRRRRGGVATLSRRRSFATHRIESLESRRLLATFTVTNTADTDTVGTLRWAINQSNANPGQDTIDFAIPGAGPHTIQPLSPLPSITDQVTINGASQDPLATTPQIEIDGSMAGADVDGLRLTNAATTSASGSIISTLAINRFSGAAIAILSGANSVAIRGNFLGTDPSGAVALPNDVGVRIQSSFSNTVGGVTTDFRNLISGNTSAGVHLLGSTALANLVQANIIGLALGGNSALPNQGPGVLLSGDGTANSGARSNTIGGALVASRNFIAGNVGPGILIKDAGATGNQIQGNFIGTNTSGTTAIANSVGVQISDQASGNSVGGAAAALRNIISGNTLADVLIDNADGNAVAGNYIGTNSDATAALPGNAPGGIGIVLRNDADNNTVGGTTSLGGNVISGHQGAGVWIIGTTVSGDLSAGNVLQGNVIGAAAGGGIAVPNLIGVRLSDGATNNTIGGSASGARNVISGNTENGILLEDNTTTGNIIQGNFIGMAADGSTALANGQNGILIEGAINTSIGGTVTGAGNTIAHNVLTGVRINAGTGNAIRRNSIFSNGDLGIIVPPGLQNAPVLTDASTSGTTTTVTGTLNADPNTTYTIDFYSNPAGTGDPSGAGEGQTFIGTTTVTTDSTGAGSFTAALTPAAAIGAVISALAIAPNGNTSQFAQNVTNAEPSADLSITISAAATPPAPAGQVPTNTLYTYTVVVTNNGPNNVTNVTVTNTLPTGTTFVGGTSTSGTITQASNVITVTIPSLTSGQSQTITLTIVSPATIPTGGAITATSTVTAGSGGSDPNPGNNSASLSTTVVNGVDLSVTQSINPSPAFVNSSLTIVFTVTNLSTIQATNVTLTSTLPASFNFVSATASQGTVSFVGGVLTASLGTLPTGSMVGAGASATVTVLVTPTQTGTFSNTGTAVATQPQTVANDNIATATVTVQAGLPPATTPPQVVGLGRAGTGRQPTQLFLLFNQPMNQRSTVRIQNYRIFGPGADGVLGTRDDQRIPIRRVTYNATNTSATIYPYIPLGLHPTYRLVVRGTPAEGVRGANGLFLDGAGDGQQGTDYIVNFQGQGPTSATSSVPSGPARRGARR